jgi:hypothetical protein
LGLPTLVGGSVEGDDQSEAGGSAGHREGLAWAAWASR